MAINVWKLVSIILFIVFFILSIYTVAKMSYSIGYEDGKSGIINIMKINQEKKSPVRNLGSNPNPGITRKIIYFILNGK